MRKRPNIAIMMCLEIYKNINKFIEINLFVKRSLKLKSVFNETEL